MAQIIAYKNLVIIGTSHISKYSVNNVKEVISQLRPEIVAIELDMSRFNSLTTKKRSSFIEIAKNAGFFNAAFIVLGGLLQSYLGKVVGVEPGSEMLTSIREAKKINAKLALIDQPIEITLKRLDLRFKDIMFIIYDSVVSSLKRLLVKMKIIKRPEHDVFSFDLSKVPEDEAINYMLKYLKDKMPKFYSALIADRNKVMTINLIKLIKNNPDKNIVAVMGAGHKDAVIRGVKDYFEKTI